jgi:hypothetical protein
MSRMQFQCLRCRKGGRFQRSQSVKIQFQEGISIPRGYFNSKRVFQFQEGISIPRGYFNSCLGTFTMRACGNSMVVLLLFPLCETLNANVSRCFPSRGPRSLESQLRRVATLGVPIRGTRGSAGRKVPAMPLHATSGQISNSSINTTMILRHSWILPLLLLAILFLSRADASVGDRLPEFKRCVEVWATHPESISR